MNFKVYKLKFQTAVHFGKNTLEDCEYTFCADTLFSALCVEACKMDNDVFKELLDYTMSGELCFSDSFPYMEDTYFLPKPMKRIEREIDTGNSIIKKAYKKLKYIPVQNMDEYLKGDFDVMKAPDFDMLGTSRLKVSASIRGEEETKPYRVGTYSFNEGNGLYIIMGYANDDAKMLFEELMDSLSYSGIGGKRTSGLGRYEFLLGKIPEELEKRLKSEGNEYMLLSGALPKEDELDNALEGAEFILSKRSGFIYSDNFSKEQMRKRDLYVFKSGSCVKNRFAGDVYNVSNNKGTHAVYRYAKPLFMEVDV